MANTTFKGPVISQNGFTGNITGDVTATTVAATTSATVGGGTAITRIQKSTVSVVVGTLAAAAEADVDVTVTGAAVGDSVVVTPLDATAETGLMWQAWVASANTVTIRMTNLNDSAALNGSTSNWQVLLIRS